MNLLRKMVTTGGRRVAALAVLLGCASLSVFTTESLGAPVQVRLRGNVPQAAIAQARLTGRIQGTESVPLALVLPLRDPAGLNEMLSRLYDPSDPMYRHYLTPDEFTRRYAPTVQSYRAVMAFALSRGLRVTATHPNRMLLDVTGSASQVESAFSIHLMRYEAPDGRMFRAPDDDPLLPAAISGRITGVIGLSTASVWKTHHHRLPSVQPAGQQPRMVPATQPSEVGSGPFGGLTPSDVKTAYNLNSVPLTGAGQTLGLFELDGYTGSDITAYESAYKLTSVPLQNSLLDGSTGSPGIYADEVTLDIELMIALAPGASKLVVYEAPNSETGVVDMFNRIATDNLAKQISTSWGRPENGSPSSTITAEDTSFRQMAAQGQSIYASAGDSGAYDDGSTLSVDDPASQPFMVGVGGTFLNVAGPGGAYVSESAWGDPAEAGINDPNGAGGGGGISAIWPLPSYQAGVGLSTTQRNVPDVSLDSDPNTGYSIYYQNNWTVFGGTSCAAPLWAAFTALVNQSRANQGEATLGFANPDIYTIGNSLNYTSAFHDISDGSSNLFYTTKPGYDNATGWGSFNGSNLIALLAPPPVTIGKTLVSLIFTPNPAYGGHVVSATVTLDGIAPTGGAKVSLTSGDPVTVPLPGSVTIPAGSTTTTFTFIPANPASNQIVSVVASIPTSTLTASLTVNSVPAVIVPATLTLASSTVFGSASTTGTVTLNGPAPVGGLVVALFGSNPAAIVPNNITIPGDALSATFTVGTQPVTADVAVTLSATANGTTVTAPLTVAAPAVGPIILTPATVTGGQASVGTLTLNGPAPVGGIVVALSSDNATATVPASVTIAAGSVTTTFPITTIIVSATVTANIKAVYNGLTQSAMLKVQAGGLSSLAVAPAGVISGGTAAGTVTLDAPAAAGGASITLTSSDPAVIVPAAVTVPAGQTTATFTVTTGSVSVSVMATITGTLNGVTQSAPLAVTPIRVSVLTLSAASVSIGGTVTGTVTLTSPAPAAGLSIALSSSGPAASVAAVLLVPAGATTATFPITLVSGGSVTISATVGGQTQTAGLTVLPAAGTSFPAGLNFLSVPYDYSGSSLDAVFGFTGVKLAVWQPVTGQYAVTPTAPADALRPGVGYWVRLPRALTLTQAGVPADPTTDFSIALSPGWNQIGDPFPVNVRRNAVKVSANGAVTTFLAAATGTPLLVSDLVYGYTQASGNYVYVRDSDSFQPGQGYWVYAYQAVTLIIPHPGS